MQLLIRFQLIIVSFFLSCYSGYAQLPVNAFPFSCVKDTVICSQGNCITLTAQIPNIRSSGSYVVNRISQPEGCFRQYVSAGAPGSQSFPGLDDSYSNVIALPFDFPFYGIYYSSLVVSENGYISFDVSNASQFSHYSMLSSGTGLTATGSGPGVDLPDSRYHRALIMGAYQDFNVFFTTSPGKLIKYDIIGTAPYRKWILSYNQIPLYSSACQNSIQNTQQIVLYESTGIAEVFIYSREICPGWNRGKAMIGMQDYDRSQGIMAPGRRASDTAWGGINMNESWRFTPAEGIPLYKKVELYTLAGEFVTAGDTTDIGNGNYKVTFNSVCADSTKTYVVKSTYTKFDDPSAEIYGMDTLHVIKGTGPNSQSIWIGSTSTEWEDPLNWSCSSLPTITSNVLINQGNVQVNSNVTVNSITVKPGAILNVNPGYNLLVVQPH